MTRLLLATLAGLVAGLSASPEPPPRPAERVAVVVDGSGHGAAARVAAARRRATALDADLRVPRTLTEQVAVTTALAARGYDRVYAAGLEAPYATAPLDGRVRVLPLRAARAGRG
jgi:hypothetical protein